MRKDEQLRQRFEDFGCLQPRCISTTYKVLREFQPPIKIPNASLAQKRLLILDYIIKAREPVHVVREEPAYVFANFLADFGGYMGLLLGSNLLSIYDCVNERLNKITNPV